MDDRTVDRDAFSIGTVFEREGAVLVDVVVEGCSSKVTDCRGTALVSALCGVKI